MSTITDTAGAIHANSTTKQDTGALVGRLLLAVLFILAGLGKLGASEGTIAYIASAGLPFAEPLYFATVALEILGGLLLAVGYKTRFAALALGLFSIAAAVFFHNDFANQNEVTSFLKNFAIAGGLFYITAFGAGRFSVDRS